MEHAIATKFKVKQFLIKEYTHWTLSVRILNTTLGNCVAITKKAHKHIRELSPEEWVEFGTLCKDFEHITKQAFNADKWNYLCLMMKDEHTHFHLLPRYNGSRDFAGISWTDNWWPLATAGENPEVPEEILKKVRDELKKNL